MKRRIAFCLLLLVCVLVYFKVLQADFLYYWDDQVIVMNQYTVGGWSWNNLWHICTDFHAGQYAPVMEMNFLALYTFFGYNPFWFHLANLCWHLGCVCLTGLFIVELLKKGQGISFLPKIAAAKEMESQKIDVINVENWNVVMWKQIIYHKNKYVTPQMSAFINMIMQKQQ